MTIRGVRFKLGNHIQIVWTNTLPVIVDRGRITAYDANRGRCCLRIDDGAWKNPRHPKAEVTKL